MPRTALLLLACGLATAADRSCPWIGEPTAAGLLGGPVQLRVTDKSCEFSRPQQELRIEVDRMKDPSKDFARYVKRCGKRAAQIQAIGNEAFDCSDGSILGRVRDIAFEIRVTGRIDSDEAARQAAEQVAGALF